MGEVVLPPEDAPDPAIEQWKRIDRFPFRVMTLAPQEGVEEFAPAEFGSGSDSSGIRDVRVSLTYAVYRLPDERDDPRDNPDLDAEFLRAALSPPASRSPLWLSRQLELATRPPGPPARSGKTRRPLRPDRGA